MPAENGLTLVWHRRCDDLVTSVTNSNVTVDSADGSDLAVAAALAKRSDAVIVIIGNHPTCDAGWNKCPVASAGDIMTCLLYTSAFSRAKQPQLERGRTRIDHQNRCFGHRTDRLLQE